jgi:ATP-dependent helicase/nuclease subunit B
MAMAFAARALDRVQRQPMTVRFLLGAAGSGKTHRCLAEVRDELAGAVDGLPLVFLAPKQATFQLERALLSEPGLEGYTRLQILSFERMAHMILEEIGGVPVALLDEEGRRMVLRALLAERHAELRVFRATARLPGFARQLSEMLGELQRQRMGPEGLVALAERCGDDQALADKLQDLALLLGAYLDWLRERDLQDHLALLDLAAATLRSIPHDRPSPSPAQVPEARHGTIRFGGLWLDGFAEFTPQEQELLTELVTCSRHATLAFCLPSVPESDPPWLSSWSAVSQTYRRLWNRLAAVPELRMETIQLPAMRQPTRFDSNPTLRRLAEGWDLSRPGDPPAAPSSEQSVRLALCDDPEGEATLAAREILAHLRGASGRRFRDVGLLLRTFEGYHDVLSRVFQRYEIPFFIDRREPVAHHPLAELTRYALRTVAFNWRHEDWFGALKSGLVPTPEPAIDELENESLARGWEGTSWFKPVSLPDEPWLEARLERTRRRVVPPFRVLAESIATSGGRVNGRQLSDALLTLWSNLRVEDRLEQWSTMETDQASEGRRLAAVHRSVWEQMRSWLDNLERAFAVHPLSLHEWLPVLESGLSGLSVGVIPPALDQVMIGTIDRSRNPDLSLVLVLGMNDTIFPAHPPGPGLLSEPDRSRLEGHGLWLDPGWRGWLGRERYYGYIALTRARDRLVITCAGQDGQGRALSPSPFLARVERALPEVRRERVTTSIDWTQAQHRNELLAPAIGWCAHPDTAREWAVLSGFLPAEKTERIVALAAYDPQAVLSATAADALYGPVLRTSVSALEKFAACPFQFFVQAGLRAGERRQFEIDAREKGSFQHEVLARFHRELQAEGRRWRDLTPTEARDRVGRIVTEMTSAFRDGLFGTTPEQALEAGRLGRLVQEYVEVAVGWMDAYGFDPVAVELGFGGRSDLLPAWVLPLDEERSLAIRGKIDRIDLASQSDEENTPCVVVDYKAGGRRLDESLLENGIQIQLPAYLAALRRLPNPRPALGVGSLVPAGVFYVNLRGRYESGAHRNEVLSTAAEMRRLAYRHSGRFNAAFLRVLDRRDGVVSGEQFNYRLTAKGELYANCQEPMQADAFEQMLDRVESRLCELGRRIYAGIVDIDPYRHGGNIACDQCAAGSICRIDPWTHRYRSLARNHSAAQGTAP